MIKVGDVKSFKFKKNHKTGKKYRVDIPYSYSDIQYDIDGWVDSKKYLPLDFDLVYMKVKGKKTIPGWITGTTWDGIRYKKKDKVIFWKRNAEENVL